MNFHGTQAECAELIAEVDVMRGFPRGYTMADTLGDDPLVVLGRGTRIEDVRTETIARSSPTTTDDEGNPVGTERGVRIPGATANERPRFARSRVLRLLNTALPSRLVTALGGPIATKVVAAREAGRIKEFAVIGLTSAERDVLRAKVTQQTSRDEDTLS